MEGAGLQLRRVKIGTKDMIRLISEGEPQLCRAPSATPIVYRPIRKCHLVSSNVSDPLTGAGDCEFAVVLFANLGARTGTYGANDYWLVISGGSCFARMQ